MIYKIIYQGTAFVEADNETDALGAFNDDMTIVSDIGDCKIEKSTVSQMRRCFYQTNKNGVCEH